MEYNAGKTKTAQLIESEDVANIKIRLKYASKEIELPSDYTVIIVPKYQWDSIQKLELQQLELFQIS